MTYLLPATCPPRHTIQVIPSGDPILLEPPVAGTLDFVWTMDVLTFLRQLPPDSIDCCVSSPPYFGLRDYGTDRWEGGDPNCQHRVGNQVQDSKAPGAITSGMRPGVDASTCKLCGAQRVGSQIGLEATPQAYVERLVDVYREVRRVLKPSGTVWINLGDSYANDDKWGGYSTNKQAYMGDAINGARTRRKTGLKPKDRMLMPARVAIALQDDGWWIRDEIVWHKPNPLPASVTDRTTTAHEMVYMLTKRARYWYDQEAIREPSNDPSDVRGVRTSLDVYQNRAVKQRIATINPETAKAYPMRNCRSVWTIATEPLPFEHFAAFPSALPRRCILAGCPEQVCSVCGKPYVRITERQFVPQQDVSLERGMKNAPGLKPMYKDNGWVDTPRGTTAVQTLSWQPTCTCQAPSRPGVVLDPFMGSGTIALVARGLGRHFVGCDLSPAYVAIARERLRLPFESHYTPQDTSLVGLPLFEESR